MDKKLLSLVSLFFLTFAIFAGVVVFNKPLTQFTRAKEDVLPSPQKSLLLAWPLKVEADGSKSSSITVFIRSATDRPIPNKQVVLTTTVGTLQNTTQTTDSEGKAVFTLVSSQAGLAELSAAVDGTPLTQKITVKFE